MELQQVIDALRTHLPAVMRWSGSVARRMRGFNIAIGGKSSGKLESKIITGLISTKLTKLPPA
jgi:3'(2'), 5'-bisphosphate nucleotidase